MPLLPRSARALLVAGVSATSFVPCFAQGCPPDPKPQTKAPIAGLDPYTLGLGSFDGSAALATFGGPKLSKVTYPLASSGIFGTSALSIGTTPGVAIFPSLGLPTQAGTIEMWVKPGSAAQPSVLFSLRGSAALLASSWKDLIFGESGTTATPSQSRVFPTAGSGPIAAAAPSFTTWTPRGIAAGDVDGDGIHDLVVANYDANLLSQPSTPLHGEIHFHRGPITAATIGAPDQILEVDLPQGLVLADFDLNGTLDLMISSFDPDTEALYGYANDGHGVFKRMKLEIGENAPGEAIAAGDVDQDGILDVLYASLSDVRPSRLCIGRVDSSGYQLGGSGGITYPLAPLALGASLGDVDGDGAADAVLAQPLTGAGRIAIHRNVSGSFASTPTLVVPTTRPFTVNATRDLDRDGSLDLAVANWRNGMVTSHSSTVFYGPFPGGAKPPRSFAVDDAVSLAIGDLNHDGTDDLVFHSATATQSPVFLLDSNGVPLAGSDGGGVAKPSLLLPSIPTLGNPNGEGAGQCIAFGGTATYGSTHVSPNSLELRHAAGRLSFTLLDASGRRHFVDLPFPPAGDAYAVAGFHHVQAEWDAASGVVQLRVGHPAFGTIATATGAPFALGPGSPEFRLGSAPDGDSAAKGYRLDDLRLSNVRRSAIDSDGDGVQNGFDVCPYLSDPTQADPDGDGIGLACSNCMADLGYQGPGSLRLSVCGSAVSLTKPFGVRVRCGAPNAPFVLIVSATAMVAPIFGGTLIPAPPIIPNYGALGPTGEFATTFPYPGSSVEAYLQAMCAAADTPNGVSISNAVKVFVQ